jgi:hypothetical protein
MTCVTSAASSAALRRHLRLRAAVLAVAGVGGGIALGAILSVLVVDLVALTAGAVLPQPPLRLYVDWTTLGVGAAAYVLVTALLIAVVTAVPFREPRRRALAEPA